MLRTLEGTIIGGRNEKQNNAIKRNTHEHILFPWLSNRLFLQQNSDFMSRRSSFNICILSVIMSKAWEQHVLETTDGNLKAWYFNYARPRTKDDRLGPLMCNRWLYCVFRKLQLSTDTCDVCQARRKTLISAVAANLNGFIKSKCRVMNS